MDPETGEWDGAAFDRLYDPWWEAQRARWADQPENYAAGLEDFFASSVRRLLGDAEGENRVCSPVNLCVSLAMLAELTDGESRQQILDLLVAGFYGKVSDLVTPLPFHQAVFFQCVAKAQITVPSCGFVGVKGA